MNPRTFLVSGLVAGLVGGLLAFVVAFTIGEPPIDDAIALEEAAAAPADHTHADGEEGHTHSHGDEEEGGITRDQQAGPGLATATVLFGAVLGGVVGIATAFATGRLGSLRPGTTAALVTGIGFTAFAFVPWLKYPPNPPAVGSGDTIDERTARYFGFVLISVLAAVAAVVLVRYLLDRSTTWVAVSAGLCVFVVVVGIAALVLPAIDEVPDTFPANTLFEFRIGALGTQVALWGGIGLALSGLLTRAWNQHVDEVERKALAASL